MHMNYEYENTYDLIEKDKYCLHSDEEIFQWLEDKKNETKVCLEKVKLSDCSPWYYDDSRGEIRNERGTFFQISAIRNTDNKGTTIEQPIIIQNEIGFLGILCKKIMGTWHYLMQAKIEPGNVNKVQISPTIQATKSNFTRQHGGAKPPFLEYFLNMKKEDVLVDQIQSEQSSRFWGKRNRNVILITKDDVKENISHKWMTLAQIKSLMHCDNLVNMDTRTVLSCIPYTLLGAEGDLPFRNKAYFYKSAVSMDRQTIVNMYHYINNYKMFDKGIVQKIPLKSLRDWKMIDKEFVCSKDSPFKVIFCNVEIEGREVASWNQPLFEAIGSATIGLICCDDNGILKFLVRMTHEVGCFDGIEIGPSIQQEPGNRNLKDCVTDLFWKKMKEKRDIVVDVLLSEEGGRFYQEQNRNVIIMIKKEELCNISEDYIWSDYGTLNILTQINNCLNIQLRNLLSIFAI